MSAADDSLPEEMSFPRSRREVVVGLWRHIVLAAVPLYLMWLSAWSGQWWWAVIWISVLVFLATNAWTLANARLVLCRANFEYRIARKRWVCNWADTQGFAYGGSRLGADGFVEVHWMVEGPEFMGGTSHIGKLGRLIWTFGLKPLRLAETMARFRQRAIKAERPT